MQQIKQPIPTTIRHAYLDILDWFDRLGNLPTPLACVICIVAVAGIIATVGRMQSAPSVAAVPTPSLPVIVIQKEQPAAPAPVQQVAAVMPAAPRYVVGFDSPNGTALGAVPAPALAQITARWGDSWVQTLHEGSPIWIRASDLGMNLANVAPVPQLAPQVVYVAQEAPQEAPPEAVATPAPCYHSERQAMLQGMSIGLATGDSCSSQQDADELAARAAFAMLNAAQQPAPPVYQVMSPRQQNIQSHYVPAPAADRPMPPSPPDDVQRALMQEAWREEHCTADRRCIP